MDNENSFNLLGSVLTQKPKKIIVDEETQKNIIEFNELRSKFEKLEQELARSKKDFVIFLGLFASLITYLSIEIKILKSASDLFLLLGLSNFFLGTILLFAMTLNNLINGKDSWKNFWSPSFLIFYILILISFICFFLHFNSR